MVESFVLDTLHSQTSSSRCQCKPEPFFFLSHHSNSDQDYLDPQQHYCSHIILMARE